MPFNRPTLSDLLDRARDDIDGRLPGADSRLRRSVLDVLARVHSAGLNGLYAFQQWISLQILPDTSEAEILARQAAIWGIRRKTATLASGFVDLIGVDGAIVPAGTLLARGDRVEYATSADVAIAAGVGKVRVEAVEAGLGGNALANQPLTFVSPVAGVQAVAKVTAGDISGGAEEEDDESLRARLLDRIRRPPHGGSKSDYERWALEVPGVTRAWVYPGQLGPGTVSLIFVVDGRANIIPPPADVAIVQDYIDERRPVTATLVVMAPVPKPLELTIRAIPATDAVKTAIQDAIDDLLAREAIPGAAILISHIREAISLAAGETDHELIAPIGNIVPYAGELIVPGNINWVGA